MNMNPRSIYSELVNKASFDLYVPEYYNVNISDYFKKEHKGPPPIVNGIQVSWEEYLQREGAEDPNEYFTPDPLYVGEDLNRTLASKSPAGIVDLTINDVAYSFVKDDDIPAVLTIYDGYLQEISPYIVLNPEAQQVVENVNQTRLKLENYYKSVVEDLDIKYPNTRHRVLSISELLQYVK